MDENFEKEYPLKLTLKLEENLQKDLEKCPQMSFYFQNLAFKSAKKLTGTFQGFGIAFL